MVASNILMSTTLIPENYVYMQIYNEFVGGVCGIIVLVLYLLTKKVFVKTQKSKASGIVDLNDLD